MEQWSERASYRFAAENARTGRVPMLPVHAPSLARSTVDTSGQLPHIERVATLSGADADQHAADAAAEPNARERAGGRGCRGDAGRTSWASRIYRETSAAFMLVSPCSLPPSGGRELTARIHSDPLASCHTNRYTPILAQ